jgi:hypothetical protein
MRAQPGGWGRNFIRQLGLVRNVPVCLTFALAVKNHYIKLKKDKFPGRSPQANYTDRATAACRRS